MSGALQIVAAKAPTSPRASSSVTTVLFSDIVALDADKSSGSGGGGAPVTIATSKSRKPMEIEMRSRDERQELAALLAAVVPALLADASDAS